MGGQTPETPVVLLTTQRSRVQIPPRYQGRGPLPNKVAGLFTVFVHRPVRLRLVCLGVNLGREQAADDQVGWF